MKEFVWEFEASCKKCDGTMVYAPKTTKLKFGTGMVNYYKCKKCNFKALPNDIDLERV